MIIIPDNNNRIPNDYYYLIPNDYYNLIPNDYDWNNNNNLISDNTPVGGVPGSYL